MYFYSGVDSHFGPYFSSPHPERHKRLHSFGLLRASFRPKGQIAKLRAYLRQRERLLEYGA